MSNWIYIRVLNILLLLLGIRAVGAAQTPPLEKRRILEGRVELLVPVGFEPMTAEMLHRKYPTVRPPQEVFTNEAGTTNVAFNWTQSKASQKVLASYEPVLHSSLQKAYPAAVWAGHGMRTINGRQVGYQELVTPAADTDIYNLMFFTDVNGRLLIVTFNCLKRDLPTWKNNAQKIMQSLRVVE